MSVLVEIHCENELDRLDLDAIRLLGVNSRNLRTFAVDSERLAKVAESLPPIDSLLLVAESGIQGPEDVNRARSAGARAMLVGESLLTDPDPAQRINRLLGRTQH